MPITNYNKSPIALLTNYHPSFFAHNQIAYILYKKFLIIIRTKKLMEFIWRMEAIILKFLQTTILMGVAIFILLKL